LFFIGGLFMLKPFKSKSEKCWNFTIFTLTY
jgi:hypothetical protein